jgi:signal peptidase I
MSAARIPGSPREEHARDERPREEPRQESETWPAAAAIRPARPWAPSRDADVDVDEPDEIAAIDEPAAEQQPATIHVIPSWREPEEAERELAPEAPEPVEPVIPSAGVAPVPSWREPAQDEPAAEVSSWFDPEPTETRGVPPVFAWEPEPMPAPAPSSSPARSPSPVSVATQELREAVPPPEPPAVTKERKWTDTLRFVAELPLLVALALGIALLIKAFLVQPFYIEQESMLPTLHPSERVLVSKLNWRFGDPARGDVVIFHNPRNPCSAAPDSPRCNPSFVRRAIDWVVQTFGLPTGTSDDLVKRIVGLPGETIAMHDGELFVCQTPGCHPLNADGTPKDGLRVEFARTEKKGPDLDRDEIAETTIPEDQYYVLGDNRDGSVDSRTFGPVPRKEFVGKVVVLLWPPTRWQGL